MDIPKMVYLPVERLHPHPDNPRKDLGDLTELADSIKQNGILQNLTVVPNGDDFLAWECMNTLPVGTMYRTDDEKWMYHANGISCRVFKKAVNPSTGQDDYLEIFEGVICEGPKNDGE